jgi:hypothetical protein
MRSNQKECDVIGRIIAIGIAITLVPASMAWADDVGGEPIVVPSAEKPVTAPMPATVQMESTSLGLGVGVSWGAGTLSVEGEHHAFEIKGLSLGEVGYVSIDALGDVQNLENPADLAGTYIAVEAGAAAGAGASVVTMRNEKGVVITLQSDTSGVQLALGAEALRIELK